MKKINAQTIDMLAKLFFGLCFSFFSFVGVRLYNRIDQAASMAVGNAAEIKRVEAEEVQDVNYLRMDVTRLESIVLLGKHEDYISVPKPNPYEIFPQK